MDSVFDRWGEGVVYLGILWGTLEMGLFRPVILTGAASVAAFMVSYVRAKSESEGFTPGKGMAAVGLAPREVRIVILTLGLIGAGVIGTDIGSTTCDTCAGGAAYPAGALVLEAALGLIAVLGTLTVIQRILHVVRQPLNDTPNQA